MTLKLSNKVNSIGDSITLKANALANSLAEEGKEIFNLTAGQLPIPPLDELIEKIKSELAVTKSFQYAPTAGDPAVRKKVLDYISKTREISLEKNFGCLISNGAKQSVHNVIEATVNPGDEVIVFSPYWISYPELIKIAGGIMVPLESSSKNRFVPDLDQLEDLITDKTKLIMVNSPNNPSGTFYTKEWMTKFANVMKKYPNIWIMSDEIYYELSYVNEAPTYFYQVEPELLDRTIIIHGISKSFACTGLRIGFAVGNQEIVGAMTRLQSHTTSGANSLIQAGLREMDFFKIGEFLKPVLSHLASNQKVIKEILGDEKLGIELYESDSAFYYLIDITGSPRFQSLGGNTEVDYSEKVSESLLKEEGVAVVPGIAFGVPNTVRISLVAEKDTFFQALTRIKKHLLD